MSEGIFLLKLVLMAAGIMAVYCLIAYGYYHFQMERVRLARKAEPNMDEQSGFSRNAFFWPITIPFALLMVVFDIVGWFARKLARGLAHLTSAENWKGLGAMVMVVWHMGWKKPIVYTVLTLMSAFAVYAWVWGK